MPRGIRSFYPGKLQKPITVNATGEAHATMQHYEEVTEASRTDLFEHAWRKLVGLPLNRDLDQMIRTAKRSTSEEAVAPFGTIPALPV